MSALLGFAGRHWLPLALAALAFWAGAKAGAAWTERAAYARGWDEGRQALAADTSKALQEKNDAARLARESLLRDCLHDPDCLHADDGWRIDRTD